jgi:uncharacterized protein (TIGR04255 family)
MVFRRKIFENNKISEALCQLRFEESIDTSKQKDFYELLLETGVYSENQDIPIYNVLFKPIENELSNTTSIIKAHKMLNESKDKVIQLFSDNISFHQVGNYKNWSTFKSDILLMINCFKKIYQPNIIRIDLRTINTFDFNLNEELSNYFNLYLNSPACIERPFNFDLMIERNYDKSGRLGAVRLNNIVRKEKQRTIFDLSYVVILENEAVSINNEKFLNEEFDYGHSKNTELFNETISEKLKKIIQ